jgi:rare lipoprotein A
VKSNFRIMLPMKKLFYSLIFCSLLTVHCSLAQNPASIKNGNASFYHDRFHGQETSNGERYDKDDFTAAHRTLPFNTLLLVTNKKNNKSVIVRVNDRGPFAKSRVIDLSHSAAMKIGMVPFGVVPVKIDQMDFLNTLPMNDSLFHEGEAWDCFGEKQTLTDTAILVWRTDNWKHAFYMASSLSLEYKLKMMLVRVTGSPEKRTYDLYVSGITNEIVLKVLINNFRSAGFTHAKIIYSLKQEEQPRVDLSTK